jgi:L-ornithine N5-oxygenase
MDFEVGQICAFVSKEVNMIENSDVACIGLGPANLALMLAWKEEVSAPGISFKAYEAQTEFGWHKGMLLEEGTMQVSFLKDLVTQRNPTSQYSFLSYLKSKGRLSEFVNLRTFYPTRIEFHDYLSWCASSVDEFVCYGNRLENIELVEGNAGQEDRLLLNFGSHEIVARTAVFGRGLQPSMPLEMKASDRVWHSSSFVNNLALKKPLHNSTFVVIGGGQSAVECAIHLYDKYPNCRLHMVFSGFGPKPADDSPFVNQLFDSENVDLFSEASGAMKEWILSRHADTNYGAVDIDLLQDLYKRWYAEKIYGSKRIQLHRCTRVSGISEEPDLVRVSVKEIDGLNSEYISADYAICATGYKSRDIKKIVGSRLASLLSMNDTGRYVVDGNHRHRTTRETSIAIFSHEDCEHSHGLSATLISNLAVRAGKISRSIRAHVNETQVVPEL